MATVLAIQGDGSSRLGDEMKRICVEECFQYYVMLSFPQADRTSFFENVISTNWPDSMFKKYRQSDQFFASVFMDLCRKTTLPVVSASGTLYARFNRDSDLPEIGAEICGFSVFEPGGTRYLAIFSGTSLSERDLHPAFIKSLGIINEYCASRLTPPDHPLSRREVECLRWTAAGKSSKEISMILDLSAATINGYVKTAIRKLDVTNRAQAVALACRLRII